MIHAHHPVRLTAMIDMTLDYLSSGAFWGALVTAFMKAGAALFLTLLIHAPAMEDVTMSNGLWLGAFAGILIALGILIQDLRHAGN